VDVHKRRCKVVELDQGEIRKPMANTREDWLEMLTELPPEAEIGLEVSTAGYFAMSVLEEAGWRGSTVIAGRRTTAWTPSGWRPSWPHTHLDRLPEAWFPPPAIRELRLRARQRCWLALLRTRAKNHVQSLLEMHGLQAPGSDPFGAAGQKRLREQKLPLPLTGKDA